MKTQRKFAIGIALAAAALVGFGVIEICRGPRSVLAGFDQRMHARYEEISLGQSKQASVDALGKPLTTSNDFDLPQKHGFEHRFRASERSSAVEYYQWINGVNWYYCIGFDFNGAVVIKAEGHS